MLGEPKPSAHAHRRRGVRRGVLDPSVVLVLALSGLAGCSCERPREDPVPAATTPPASLSPDEAPSHATFRVDGDEALARKPVLAIVESGGQMLGAFGGPPAFVLFDDRHVIAKRGKAFVEGDLTGEAFEALLAEVRGSGLMGLPARFTGGVLSSHSVDTSILVREGERYKRVSVDGFHDGKPAWLPEGVHREPPPEPFAKVARRLASLEIPDAKPWEPMHSMAILRRVDGEAELWPASIPAPGTGRFSPAGDDALVYHVVPRALAVSEWVRTLESGLRTPKPGPYAWSGAAYELVHLGDSIEARTYLLRVERCARPDASRDVACAPPK